MTHFTPKILLAFVLGLSSLHTVAEDISVIVSPSTAVDSLASEDVMRIFLGKSKEFPNSLNATPIAQREGSDIRTSFVSKVLKKTAEQEKAYWSQLIFTGRGAPPDELGSDAEVKKQVSGNPGTVGYINSSAVDNSVKVLYTME